MPVDYAYQAVNTTTGNTATGTITADSREEVELSLRDSGMLPMTINEAPDGFFTRSISLSSDRVKLKDLAVWARQFAVMINAGLSLLRALTVLTEQTSSDNLRKILTQIRTDVEDGSTLAEAMEKHPTTFSPMTIAMVRAGETGGFLDRAMTRIADSLDAEMKLRSSIKGAMVYPVVVLIFAAIISVAMLIFVVPVFANMFEALGGELPFPTQILVAISNSMIWLLPTTIVFALTGWYVWRNIKHRPEVRSVVDKYKLRLPVIGDLMQKLAIARFTRNLSTLLSAGVPILQALDIVGETAGNYVVETATQEVKNNVQAGELLHQAMEQHPIYPPMAVQMVAVGEDTGALDEMLIRTADFYDDEVASAAQALTSSLEPILLVGLGTLVGATLVSLYLPLFNLYDYIQ